VGRKGEGSVREGERRGRKVREGRKRKGNDPASPLICPDYTPPIARRKDGKNWRTPAIKKNRNRFLIYTPV
jgi:hypothetical protein